MNINLTEFLLSIIGGSSAAILVVAFLGKRLVINKLLKDLEKYKNQLTEKTESLKFQLSIYAHEQNVSLSRIDSQRSEAIIKLYSAMCAWHTCAIELLEEHPLIDPVEENRYSYFIEVARRAKRSGDNLTQELLNQAIYFDEETFNKLSELVKISTSSVSEMVDPLDEGLTVGVDYEDLESYFTKAHITFKKTYPEKISPKYEEIKTEFRRLLGSIREKTNPKI